jgi:glycerol-3-phosphate dehydrogenase (NAD(P)+)
MNIGIIGLGNFGFALLKHLDMYNNRRYNLKAFDIDTDLISYLRGHHEHKYLHKGVKIGEEILFVDSLEEVSKDVDIIILAFISSAFRVVIPELSKFAKEGVILLNTAKALDFQSGTTLSELTKNLMGDKKYNYAVLSGGTIASELFCHEPLGIDIACYDTEVCNLLISIFNSDSLNAYPTEDVKGVEYAGAFKNVIAIFAGIVSGLGLSYGSETHFISRASGNIKNLCVDKLGAQAKTFSMESQSWGNDYWMSCTGNSRNRYFGQLIGQGLTPKEALEEMKRKHLSVEGVNTLKILMKVIGENKSQYPILTAVHKIIIEEQSPREIIRMLMCSDCM